MGRIRCIKPEFPQSESIGRLSRDGRLLFVQLWTFVDDSGRARAASRMLASLLYPYDDDAPSLIDVWLKELERERVIVIYEVDRTRYLQITNWLKHQKIDRPTPSKIPQFDEASRGIAKDREASSTDMDKEVEEEEESFHRTSPIQDLGVPDTTSGYNDLNEAVLSRVIVPARTLDLPLQPDVPRRAESILPKGVRAKSMESDPECAAFYSAYPRHDAPDDAFKAWQQVIKTGAKPADIMAGLERYQFPSDRQYIKLPASWLRAGCWKSQPNEAPRPKPSPSNPRGHTFTPMTGGF